MAEGTGPIPSAVALFLIQVSLIIVVSRVLGAILKRLKQPLVISEILSGIVLGPTAMGRIPGFTNAIFPKTSLTSLGMFANMGLLFFMFLIGLELDTKLMKAHAKKSAFVASSSIIVPFCMGVGASYYLFLDPENAVVPFGAFLLFEGAAMSITAFPVLARILTERKLLDNKVGVMVLSAAAINDVVGWILLAFSVAMARSANPADVGLTILWAALFIGGMILIVSRIISWGVRKFKVDKAEHVPQFFIMVTFLMLFASSYIAEVIGIHAMFGAFVLGAIMPKEHGLDHKITEKLEDMVVLFLLPLYFVNSGLKTQFGLLNSGHAWEMAGVVILCAVAGKVIGAGVAARLTGLNARESLTVGVLMDTRGLVELIVLNLGLDLGVITPVVFSIMVLMALFTTFITSPIVAAIYPMRIALEGRRPKDPNVFRILLCISDIEIGTTMVSIGNLLCSSRRLPGKLYGLQFLKLTERPSSYMRAQIPSSDPVTVAVEERARTLKQRIKMSRESSTNTSQDILHANTMYEPSLTVLGWARALPSAAAPDAVPQSRVITDVLRSAQHTTGVLVNKDAPAVIRHILVPYFGEENDTETIAIACRMAKTSGVKVTILTVPPFKAFNETEQALMARGLKAGTITVQHKTGDKSLGDWTIDTAASRAYDLIVVSTGTDWASDDITPFGSIPNQFIEACPTSILFVHDCRHRAAKGSVIVPIPSAPAKVVDSAPVAAHAASSTSSTSPSVAVAVVGAAAAPAGSVMSQEEGAQSQQHSQISRRMTLTRMGAPMLKTALSAAALAAANASANASANANAITEGNAETVNATSDKTEGTTTTAPTVSVSFKDTVQVNHEDSPSPSTSQFTSMDELSTSLSNTSFPRDNKSFDGVSHSVSTAFFTAGKRGVTVSFPGAGDDDEETGAHSADLTGVATVDEIVLEENESLVRSQ